MKKIFIITGEYSGDTHAAAVARHLRECSANIILEGIGGEQMEAEGVKLFRNHSKMGAVGLSPQIIIDHIKLGRQTADYILNEYKPDIVLLVDYGGFNLNLAHYLKKHHYEGKILYYIPPQIWASRKYRIKTVKKYIDKVLCIFPFEDEMYKEYGIDVHYCGHPLISQLPEKANREEFFERHGFNPEKPLVAVFPGSRKFELKYLMKLFIESAKTLQRKHPDLQVCFSMAPNLSDSLYYKYFKNCDFKVIKGENQALLSSADGLILASGTVALEAALYKTPFIIAYRAPWLFYLIYLVVRCIDKVSLPNIICNKMIIPELVQPKATHDNIVFEEERLLYDKKYREQQINELENVREKLSEKCSSAEAVKVIWETLAEENSKTC